VEAQKSKSSMVAMNVAIFPSFLIVVTTFLSQLMVLMDKSFGVLKLSGETALAIASTVLASSYSNIISASNLLASQLSSNQFVNNFDK